MARVPDLETILQAWFDLETCASEEQSACKRQIERFAGWRDHQSGHEECFQARSDDGTTG